MVVLKCWLKPDAWMPWVGWGSQPMTFEFKVEDGVKVLYLTMKSLSDRPAGLDLVADRVEVLDGLAEGLQAASLATFAA